MAQEEADRLRIHYENIIRGDATNVDGVLFLASWHLERQSYNQAVKYFAHLSTLQPQDANIWLCLTVSRAMVDELLESEKSLLRAAEIIPSTDIRIKFCRALIQEKRKEYPAAMDGYLQCLSACNNALALSAALGDKERARNGRIEIGGASSGGSTATTFPPGATSITVESEVIAAQRSHNGSGVVVGARSSASSPSSASTELPGSAFFSNLRSELSLRMAVVKMEMGAWDQAMLMCSALSDDATNPTVRANALCLKGLLNEMKSEYPASEVVYRAVLQICPGHACALERLGRVYLRYRETIPAAVQCFFKSVESNPSNHVAWYLLGRCYMATSQYSDACEAYNRAVNLNPNDPQVWCSLGVLYYAFGHYREALGLLARALKLDSTMADAWYNVGALYDMCNQPADAQLAYQRAKENGLAERFARSGMGLGLSASAHAASASGSTTAGKAAVTRAAGGGGSVAGGNPTQRAEQQPRGGVVQVAKGSTSLSKPPRSEVYSSSASFIPPVPSSTSETLVSASSNPFSAHPGPTAGSLSLGYTVGTGAGSGTAYEVGPANSNLAERDQAAAGGRGAPIIHSSDPSQQSASLLAPSTGDEASATIAQQRREGPSKMGVGLVSEKNPPQVLSLMNPASSSAHAIPGSTIHAPATSLPLAQFSGSGEEGGRSRSSELSGQPVQKQQQRQQQPHTAQEGDGFSIRSGAFSVAAHPISGKSDYSAGMSGVAGRGGGGVDLLERYGDIRRRLSHLHHVQQMHHHQQQQQQQQEQQQQQQQGQGEQERKQ